MRRFILEKSQDLPGWWVLTDAENLVVLKFKEHEFNESQQVTFIDDDKSVIEKLGAQGVAQILREMGDYMFTHWYIALPFLRLSLSLDKTMKMTGCSSFVTSSRNSHWKFKTIAI